MYKIISDVFILQCQSPMQLDNIPKQQMKTTITFFEIKPINKHTSPGKLQLLMAKYLPETSTIHLFGEFLSWLVLINDGQFLV